MSKDSFIDNLVDKHEAVKATEAVPVRFLRWMAISILCVVAGIFFKGIREDWSVLFSNPSLLIQNVLILLMIVLTGYSAIRLSVPGSLNSKASRNTTSWPLVGWLACLGLIAYMNGFSLEKAQKIAIFGCTTDILVIGVLPGLALFFFIFQGSVLKRGHAGYLAMIASFGLGAWAVQFTCHNDDPLHIFVWHFMPVLVFGILGIKLGNKFLPKL